MSAQALGSWRVGAAHLTQQPEQDRLLEGHAKHRPHQRIHAFPVPLASGEHLVHRKGEVLGDPIHHGVQQAALGDEVVEDRLLS